ncbi:hypothetical protein [Natronorubrum sp. A-ect3]|uniref:hypothetical protein n=1 Tax=Natronorubrum sp. A-ect3 TaxID=3242698 RepID=UPI00359DE617
MEFDDSVLLDLITFVDVIRFVLDVAVGDLNRTDNVAEERERVVVVIVVVVTPEPTASDPPQSSPTVTVSAGVS